jgi:nitric oxide reductase activation protein
MQVIVYWEVSSVYDRCSTHIGNFLHEGDALAVAGGKNSVYKSVTSRTMFLFESVEDFEENTREKIRARAIAKLTPEEKMILGIKL